MFIVGNVGYTGYFALASATINHCERNITIKWCSVKYFFAIV